MDSSTSPHEETKAKIIPFTDITQKVNTEDSGIANGVSILERKSVIKRKGDS